MSLFLPVDLQIPLNFNFNYTDRRKFSAIEVCLGSIEIGSAWLKKPKTIAMSS